MARPIPILFEDAHLLVVSKPAGLLSVVTGGEPGASLPEALAAAGIDAMPVHRLDREVSGCVLFARTEVARAEIEDMFRARALKKTYWALAQGRVQPAEGAFHFPILEDGPLARVSVHGKKSETRFRTLNAWRAATELEVDLVTGRYNQIRLHFAHAGFALVGERKYARGKDSPVHAKSRRVALHAWRLEFDHPLTSEPVAVEAPLPDDLIELRKRASLA
ncbi:MAG: RNA pseudouridine synthase [Planctomycetes bacterium]|nr:RNA pseudouridine synthase [Planctomycetota bacterium]